ncbi:MAG: hypothetical protein K5685_00200 [Bacteroidales bacterium]|nr:hypothetical protein [Bacteroidales bacterium]
MNIIKAYSRGFKNSLRRPKMIFLIYAICLLLGLSLALPFFFSFQSASGNSMISKSLDYTTFSELLNFHSWNLESIFHQGVFTVFVYWLLMVFFVGGIIRSFNREDYSVSTFFSGAGVNFLRFLLCDVLMIAAQIVMFFLLFGLASLLLKLFGNIVSERPLFWAYAIAGFVYACVVVLLLMISDYAKFYMEMAETHRVFKAIGKAVKYVFNNFVKTYFLYALLLVVPVLTLILYKLTFDKIGTAATWGLIAMFFVQQFFIVLRIWFRVWSLSSQFEMFADDYVKVSVFDVDIATQDTDEDEKEEEKKIEINKKVEVTTTTTTAVVETKESVPETESALETESEPETEYDNLIVKPAVENNKEQEVEVKEETIVLNDEGDTFTTTTTTVSKEHEESKEEEIKEEEKEPEYDNLIVENGTENNSEVVEVEKEEVAEEEKEEVAEEEKSDEVDEELMTQFYDNAPSNTTTTTTTVTTTETVTETVTEEEAKPSEVSIEETEEEELPGYNPDEQDDYQEDAQAETEDFSINTAMGANISLEEEEEEIVTTVTEESDPKIVKLTDVTEVVPESELDGEPSFEKHREDEFAEFVDEDDNEKAKG